jgi:hypothetical protein
MITNVTQRTPNDRENAMTTNTKRAAKGGEYGANGEWYEGGKFINTVPENSKKSVITRPAKAMKEKIADYKFEVAPAAGLRSIYAATVGIVARHEGDKLALRTDGGLDDTLVYLGKTREWAASMVARWNAGERWAPQAEVYPTSK